MTSDTTPEELAREYLDLKERAAVIDDRIKQIVAELRDNLGAGRHTAGDHTVTVTPQRRFNPDRAAEVLAGSPLLEACQETVVTSARAKQVLPPAVYETCMVEAGEARVSIR